MSIRLVTYIAHGVKMSREEVEALDSYEDIMNHEPDGLCIFSSEEQDNVIVGRLVHKTDEYFEQEIREIEAPSIGSTVFLLARHLGGRERDYDPKLYVMGAWV